MKYDKKDIFESVAKHFKYISGLVINLQISNLVHITFIRYA
jgi:hypothetical protein